MRMFFILIFSMTTHAAPLDLQKSFDAALRFNESVQVQEKSAERAKEKKRQAVGSVLPNLSAIGTYQKQDVSGLTTSQRASVLEDQTSARINLTQPIFKGTREYHGMALANRNLEAEEALLKFSKQSLYSDVAANFYARINAERDAENLKMLLDLTNQRIAELKRRTRVGKVRKGELLQASAQGALVKSQVIQSETVLNESKMRFYNLTGIRDSQLLDSVELPTQIPKLEEYISRIEKRPDIIAQTKRSEAADKEVSIAYGAHLPTVDLFANYYLKREGSSENIKWDGGLTLTMPLFEGGVTQSKVREASSLYGEAELKLAHMRRAAEVEIRNLYYNVKDGLERLQILKESTQLAELSYKEQIKDDRYGLVSSLDVLQALNSYIETKRAHDRVYYTVKTALAQLRAATGEY